MFIPKIVGFMCNFSFPKDVDVTRPGVIHGYPKIRIVRVRCIGSIEPSIVLETFVRGADGVVMMGCHPSDCHYVTGYLHAERKVRILNQLLSKTGLEPERLMIVWAYASESERFTKIIDDFRYRITGLGPSPLAGEKPDANFLLNMQAAKATVEGFRLRVLVSRERELTEEANMYGEKTSREELENVMDTTLETEYLRNKILLLLKEDPLSVKEMSTRLDLDPRDVLRHIVVMRQTGLVTLADVKGTTPMYAVLEES